MKSISFKKMFSLFLLVIGSSLLIAQDRSKDPVVVLGSELAAFNNTSPDDIVGFKYLSNTWEQVPIQIDERLFTDIGAPYGNERCGNPRFNVPWDVFFYADPNTFVGLDPNANFDTDDELVFMESDIGDKFLGTNCPSGTLGATIQELKVVDPLTSATLGYLYLFEQDGSLDQAAGEDYVDYQFALASGRPLSQYDICEKNTLCPPQGVRGQQQCENSVVTTSEYEVGYIARWIENTLKIKSGNATGVDILDSHQGFIAPSVCGRTEFTFSESRGPIVTSIDGPVRAIRSVMGSNSGQYNQLTAKFTKYRVDYVLNFRVHGNLNRACTGFVDAFDLDPTTAQGMSFFSNATPNGVAIDGTADGLGGSAVNDWELIKGAQGAIAASYAFETDIQLLTTDVVCSEPPTNSQSASIENYYDDSGTSTIHKCTGDSIAFGTFGFRLLRDRCTDRRYDAGCCASYGFFNQDRFHYYLAPNTTTNEAQQYSQYAKNPLEVQVQSLTVCNSTPSCSFVTIDTEDFETDWGIWNSGGANAARINTNSANGFALMIRNGTATSNAFTNVLDLSANEEIRISFTYASRGMETGKSFELQLSTDGGTNYSMIEEWVSGQDFSANDQQTATVTYDSPFTANCRLRFVCKGSASNDRIILDDIQIEGCQLSPKAQAGQLDFSGIANQSLKPIVEEIRLIPNPAYDHVQLSVRLSSEVAHAHMLVLDAFGKQLLRQSLQTNAKYYQQRIDVVDWPSGLYHVQIAFDDGRQISQKFVKR